MARRRLIVSGPDTEDNDPALHVTVESADVSINVELIGPDQAADLLGHNTHNRNIKKALVDRIADDIRNGDFKFNGATICFAADGTLLDGQNRLHAIVQSERAVPLIIVRGLQREAQDDMDTGAPRMFSDVLTLGGDRNTGSLSAIVRRVAAWEDGQRRGALLNWRGSHSQLSRVLAQHPELREVVNPARHVGRLLGVSAASVGLLMFVFNRIDEDDAAFFFARLEDGQGLLKGDPIFELRRTFIGDPSRGDQARLLRDIVYMIKGWNAYRTGTSVSIYRWKPGGARPDTFPEPV